MKTAFYLMGVLVLAGAIGMWLANRKADAVTVRQRWIKYFSYLIITAIVIASILWNVFFYISVIIVSASAYELWHAFLISHAKRRFVISSTIYFLVVAIGFLLFAYQNDRELALYIYLQVIVFDAFCQITGQLFGKRKLVPKISPSKTVEGLVGGSVLCIVTAVLCSRMVHATIIESVVVGLFISLLAFGGDLLASWGKRKMNLKDYSNLLPGQGGVLDRFDSFLMCGFGVVISSVIIITFFFHWD